MKYARSLGKLDFFLLPCVQRMLENAIILAVAGIMLVACTILTGCSGKGKTVAPRNLPPSINAIQLVPPRAAPGDTISASAIAGDPEGKPLVFRWKANVGMLIDSVGQSIRWVAPPTASTCSLTVRVGDEANEVSMTRVFPVGVGRLVVESFPQGARLLIDSQPTQLFTPLTISDAPVGTYTLGVERAPYVYSPDSPSVEVTDGDTTRVRFKLNESLMFVTQVSTDDCVTQSSWSPDGTKLVGAVEDTALHYRALTIFDSPWPDVFGDVIQTCVGTPSECASARYNWGPSWCPTDCSVLFASSRSGANKIYKVPICGYPYGGQAELMYAGVANYPVWSPDGSHIAFVAAEAGGFPLKVMLASGGAATTVATDVLEDRPAWSPDGSHLVFSKTVGGQPYLFSVPSTGGIQVQVSQIPGVHPSWSLDGNRIAFVSSFDGTENVWILFLDAIPAPVEGQLTSTGANWPAWRPDGLALCFTVFSPQKGCHTLWVATGLPF